MKPEPSKEKPAAHTKTFVVLAILVVVVLVGWTLAHILVPKLANRGGEARQRAAQSDIANLSTALDSFEIDNNSYPKALQALITRPPDAGNWHGPYLAIDHIPKDPWGNDYRYECPGKRNPTSFDLTSMGPDGRIGGGDDIVNPARK